MRRGCLLSSQEPFPLIITEVIIGLILGLGARLMMSALQVAGATVGLASGLGFAQQVDPDCQPAGSDLFRLLLIDGRCADHVGGSASRDDRGGG